MTEYLELYAALESIAAGDMTRESMIHTAKVALGEAKDEDDEDDWEEDPEDVTLPGDDNEPDETQEDE